MSDFVLSRSSIDEGKITKEILSIYDDKNMPIVKEFHGEWGSLGVSQNLYNGFNPYEDDHVIVTILGGPILMFRNNSFLTKKSSSEGTKAIFERWREGKINWDKDLNGPFVVLIINKKTSEITCITDIMSFIPVYSYSNFNNVVLSSHVDILAANTQQSQHLDRVSLIDFILNGIVTFPYTTYENVFQIPPASENIIKKNSIKLNSINYWLPLENNNYTSINKASTDLRKSLQRFTDKITKETTNISQFISGGEDSRAISGILKKIPRNAYIFIDKMNREGKIAEKIANVYGAKLKVTTRSKSHYLEILPNCSDLVGSGSQYHHAHTYGFHKICNLDFYDAVFGGLFSDALLKGSRIKKKASIKFPFLPEKKMEKYKITDTFNNSIFEPIILKELKKRQKNHLNYVKQFRCKSANEWFELWPSSMNHNIPNIHVNRRLFRSYEPFMSTDVVKISSRIPQKWKLNRRLFYKVVKPYLKSSKWIPHGDGWLPSFPWYINTYVRFITWFYRRISRRLGMKKGNQGPWGDWHFMVYSKQWKEFLDNKIFINKLPIINGVKISPKLINESKLTTLQYVNLTQVLYEINKNK